jgi:hypothetical protein
MVQTVEQGGKISPQTDDDAAIKARVETLRAIIQTIPEAQRAVVFARVRDLLPADLFEKSKAPQRGGPLLNNVYELFMAEPKVERGASEVMAALADKGKPAEPQPVRNALNYLHSRRVLYRIGYGKYVLEDGSI